MILFIIGASSSGKSEIAENIAVSFAQKRYYIATMHAYGLEGKARVENHLHMRAGKGFETIEKYTDIGSLRINSSSICLIECISNLLANEMYDFGGAGDTVVEKITSNIKNLATQCKHLIVVSNDVFSDGIVYDTFCTKYIQNLGRINRNIASLSSVFIESVVGIPIYHKGGANEIL